MTRQRSPVKRVVTEDPAPQAPPDTGDVVVHRPSSETWVVAYVDGDRLVPCGWPYGLAKASDCTIVRRVTPDERLKMLHALADMSGADTRKTYAKHVLAEEFLPSEY